MSASKCGNVLTFEMIEEAAKRALQPYEHPPVIVGPRAYAMLQKIKKRQPDWEPSCEADIWYKAYGLGLLEDGTDED